MKTDRIAAVIDSYRRIARKYDRHWARYLHASIARTVDALQPRPNEAILDVGCGTGLLLRQLEATVETGRLVGVDVTAAMLERAAARVGPSVRLIRADAAALPLRSGTFDAVVSSSALHHWPRPAEVLLEIRRVLRPGGRVVITDWSRDVRRFRPFAWWLSRSDPAVDRVLRAADFHRLLESTGFTVHSTAVYTVATIWGMMTIVAFPTEGG